MAATMVKILSKGDTTQCLCVYNTITGIVGAKEFINDSNWQLWRQVEYGDKHSSFQNPQTGYYMCPDDRNINKDGVKIATAADPYKWVVENVGEDWVIDTADKSVCLTMEKKTAPVKLQVRTSNDEPKFFWTLQSAA